MQKRPCLLAAGATAFSISLLGLQKSTEDTLWEGTLASKEEKEGERLVKAPMPKLRAVSMLRPPEDLGNRGCRYYRCGVRAEGR